VVTPTEVDFDDYFDSMSLYLGTIAGGLSLASATVTATAVTYAGGAYYQATGGDLRQIWEVSFENLGIYSGDVIFALAGEGARTSVHASNAALGGVTADGADNLMYAFTGTAGGPSLAYDSDFDSNGDGWDKSSDLNVLVYATPVPLPAALPMLLTAVGAIAVMRRRKRAA
jgi:hypothetical protein